MWNYSIIFTSVFYGIVNKVSMSLAEELKSHNITRKELAEYYGKDVSTINNWHRDNGKLFNAAVLGYVSYKINKG